MAIHHPKRRDEHGAGDDELDDALAQRVRRGDEVDERERRQHEDGLQHLGQEAEADECEREVQPAPARRLEGPGHAVGADGQHEDQQGVGVVEAKHQDGDGRERHDRAGEQPGAGAEPALDGQVQHADGGHAHQGLGHEQAPCVEPEEAHRQAHHPQGGRWLVDGDEVGRVAGPEEQRLPALRPRLRGRRVEGVGPPGRAEAPDVQHGRGRQQRDDGGAHPARVGRVAAQPREAPPANGRRRRVGRRSRRCGPPWSGRLGVVRRRRGQGHEREPRPPASVSTGSDLGARREGGRRHR